LRRSIVNTTDPHLSFQAVVWSMRGPWITLKDAVILTPEKPPTPVDGEVILHREQVRFFQVLP
jgi:hypothetical protein